MFFPTAERSIVMSAANIRRQVGADPDTAEEETPPHLWRREETPPTPARMFAALGLALCATVYMVSVILLFAKVLVR
jgi:hypothetical protein